MDTHAVMIAEATTDQAVRRGLDPEPSPSVFLFWDSSSPACWVVVGAAVVTTDGFDDGMDVGDDVGIDVGIDVGNDVGIDVVNMDGATVPLLMHVSKLVSSKAAKMLSVSTEIGLQKSRVTSSPTLEQSAFGIMLPSGHSVRVHMQKFASSSDGKWPSWHTLSASCTRHPILPTKPFVYSKMRKRSTDLPWRSNDSEAKFKVQTDKSSTQISSHWLSQLKIAPSCSSPSDPLDS